METTPTDILTSYGPWPIIGFLLWWITKLVSAMREDGKEAAAHIAASTAAQRETAAALNAVTVALEAGNRAGHD